MSLTDVEMTALQKRLSALVERLANVDPLTADSITDEVLLVVELYISRKVSEQCELSSK